MTDAEQNLTRRQKAANAAARLFRSRVKIGATEADGSESAVGLEEFIALLRRDRLGVLNTQEELGQYNALNSLMGDEIPIDAEELIKTASEALKFSDEEPTALQRFDGLIAALKEVENVEERVNPKAIRDGYPVLVAIAEELEEDEVYYIGQIQQKEEKPLDKTHTHLGECRKQKKGVESMIALICEIGDHLVLGLPAPPGSALPPR